MLSKTVKAARTKLQGCAGLGWSDREYVAVIKRCKDMEVQGQRCKEGARTCTARV